MSKRIEGQVSEIGKSGNLITNIANEQLADTPRDVTTTIQFSGHETVCLYDSNHDEPETTMVAFLGDSGFLEIEIVGMDLAGMLGIGTGDPVIVTWNV